MINNNFIKSFAAIGISSGVALTAVAGASAQEAPETDEPLRKGFAGVVESYEGGELKINVKRIDAATPLLMVTDDTEIKTPGPARIAGTLEEGARVGVLAIENADGTWEAVQILVKPMAPSVEAVSGAVVSKEGNVLTIEMPNGEIKEIILGEDQEAPEPGDVVTAFAKKSERAGERPTVTGLEKADKVRERIQGFLDQVSQERPDAPPAVAEARESMTERFSNLLERHTERHADLLQRVVDNDRMPEAARERIRTSLESARTRIGAVQDRIQQARERLGLPERVRPEGTPSADAAGRDAASGLPTGRR